MIQNVKVKDSLFRDLFQKDEVVGKRNFLELYNAIHHTNLKLEETKIIPKEIPQTVYMTYENDVCMEINGSIIVLAEHQSTVNENMPFRFLEYITRLYEGIVPMENRYRRKVMKIPTPEFYVFYNGLQDYPALKELRLSDAYELPANEIPLELKCIVFNIRKLDELESLPEPFVCAIMRQYNFFIERLRQYKAEGKEDYFRIAISDTIKSGVLVDYLPRKAKEVMNMCFAEYDYETDIRVQREEAFEEGEEKGSFENAIKNAQNLLKMNVLSMDQIAQAVELPLEKIKELAENITVNA